MKTYSTTTTQGREGIALILLLGMLSMILLLAVAFATTMRTERLATRNYADSVSARHLVHTGLSRAMDEIDRDMVTQQRVYPNWPMNESKTATPNPSEGFLGYKSPTDYSEDWLWIPMNPTLSKLVSGNIALVTNMGKWVEIEDPDSNDVIGRYAYAVFNTSGLLDANVIGEAATRGMGVRPEEIRANASVLGELAGKDLKARRTSSTRFETPSEVFSLVTYPNFYRSIYPYSYYPTNHLDQTGRPVDLVDISPDGIKDFLGNQAYVKQAFMDCDDDNSIGDLESTYLILGLTDYADSNSTPSSVKGPCVEDVPMLNEVMLKVTTRFDTSGGTTNSAIDVDGIVEMARPFVDGESGESFDLTYTIGVTPHGAGGPVAGEQNLGVSVSFNSRSADYDPIRMTSPVTHTYSGIAESWAVTVKDPAVSGSGGSPAIDRLYGNLTFNSRIPMPASIGAAPVSEIRDAEVLDPRFNWEPGQWSEIVTNTADYSINKINNRAVSYFSNESKDADGINLPPEDRDKMYVRNGDPRTVGELGYLPYEPWKTLRLYDYEEVGGGSHDGPHRIHDHFVMANTATNRGYVNVQSDSVAALASVWYDMPIEDYPGESSASLVDVATASNIGERVSSDRVMVASPSVTTPCDVGVSIGKLIQSGGIKASDSSSEFKREAFMRNAAELLRLRQNLFTFLVIAQSGKENPNGDFVPAAEAKAVAVVWRDPVLPASGSPNPPRPDSEGMFVRAFKWLND